MSKVVGRQSHATDPINHQANERHEWQEIKTSSTLVGRRSCHSSCLYKDNLYIYGGYDNNSPGIFSDMYAYSFKEASWRTIDQGGDLPGQRHSQTAITFKDSLVMFGGMINVMNNTNSIHSFDFTLSKWKQVKTVGIPLPIDSHKVCLYDNKMIVGMGFSENEYNQKIYELNLKTLQWKCLFNQTNYKINQYPKPRAHGSFNLLGNSIYIYGGKDFDTIYDDLWKFDLSSNTFQKIQLTNPAEGRFGHSGVIYEKRLFIFGGTKGVTHQRNDLLSIDMNSGLTYFCWIDSQEERLRIKNENSPIIKKSRRDSAKKCGIEFYDNSKSQAENVNQSPGKYRNQLKQVRYYNDLYQNHKRSTDYSKKMRKNPLLTELQGSQENQSLNMTSTFEILTNSIMLAMNKTGSRQQRNEINLQNLKRVPKARDNYSADLKMDTGEMIIFGGGMHKISYNDIILIDLPAVINKHIPQ